MDYMLKPPFLNRAKNCSVVVRLSMLLGMIVALAPANSQAQVVAKPPYSVSTFAIAPADLSAPDSITFSSTNVFVGYGNGGAPDGSGGAMSNIIEYDFNGNQIRNFTIVGHNDGLRYNPRTNELWALQNEDGNSTLIILNPQTGEQRLYHLCMGSPCTGPHGGGYDDIDFLNGHVYISASAPTLMPDSAPAIASLEFQGTEVILTGIINGNARVTSVRTGRKVTLNLTDPDSMIVDPVGELVMTSQGDGELIIVQHPGLSCQNSFVVPLSSALGGRRTGNTQLDDTVFTSQSLGMLLVADKGLNAIYEITAPYFGPGAYSAVSVFSTPTAPNPIASFVGRTNLTTGFVAPIVIGMSNPGGMAFIPSDVNLERFINESVRIPNSCSKK
jgi:hypothetical protein